MSDISPGVHGVDTFISDSRCDMKQEAGGSAVTTTPADLDAIRKLARQADDWAEYGHPNDPNWDGARTLIKQVPALLAELAESRRKECSALCRDVEEDRDRLLHDLSEDFHADSRCGIEGPECPGCVLAAAREELTKTRAELDHLRKVLDAASQTTAAAQQIVTAALADGTARVVPTAPCGCHGVT